MANSKRKCAHCKERKPAETMFIHGTQAFCDRDHYIEYAVGSKDKLVKRGQVIQRRINRERKKDLDKRTLSWQHKHTQRVFNRMRVLQELLWFHERGMVPTCISCAKPLGGDQWCCGHFKTQGGHPELRYDPKNTYLQHNHHCNQRLSADIGGTKNTMGYLAGLKHRFGEEEGQAIIDYCESHHPAKNYTCDQLEEMRAEFAAEVRRIERILNDVAGN